MVKKPKSWFNITREHSDANEPVQMSFTLVSYLVPGDRVLYLNDRDFPFPTSTNRTPEVSFVEAIVEKSPKDLLDPLLLRVLGPYKGYVNLEAGQKIAAEEGEIYWEPRSQLPEQLLKRFRQKDHSSK